MSSPIADNTVPQAIRLHRDDDVLIARTQLLPGTRLAGEDLVVAGLVPPGHKLAVRRIEAGAAVRRYGQIIGFASRRIEPGEHVHTHNLAIGSFERDYAFAEDARPTPMAAEPATFDARPFAAQEALQVHARTERAACPGQHRAAQVAVRLEPVHRRSNSFGMGLVHCVLGFGPVHCDD